MQEQMIRIEVPMNCIPHPSLTRTLVTTLHMYVNEIPQVVELIMAQLGFQ
jgi:hypothetical protein